MTYFFKTSRISCCACALRDALAVPDTAVMCSIAGALSESRFRFPADVVVVEESGAVGGVATPLAVAMVRVVERAGETRLSSPAVVGALVRQVLVKWKDGYSSRAQASRKTQLG